MSTSSPLWPDLTPLSAPVVKLIETVSDAIGVAYEPTRIRRKARAEADASIILAKAGAKVQEIEVRAANRLRAKEIRRQQNIESITSKALNALPDSVSSEPVGQDWVYDFFEYSQDISDEQMQEYWARILAGEIAKPSSFSKRTLEVVKMLSVKEAQLFAKCCSFVWSGESDEDDCFPIIFANPQDGFPRRVGLTYSDLQTLETAGLMTTGHFSIVPEKDSYQIEYFNNRYLLTPYKGIWLSIATGQALFTKAGKELLRVVKAEPDEEYEQQVISFWQENTNGILLVERL